MDIGNKVNKSINDSIYRTHSFINDTIWLSISGSISGSIYSSVYDFVWSSVRDSVPNSINISL